MKTIYYFLLGVVTIFYFSGCTKEEEKQQCQQYATNTNFTGDAVFVSYDPTWRRAEFQFKATVNNVCEYLTAKINITVTSSKSDSINVYGYVSVPGNSELGIPISYDPDGGITSGLYTLNPRQANTNPTSYTVTVNISFLANSQADAINRYVQFVSKIDITNNYYQPL